MAAMAIKFQVTIDCADPQRQARFWATALGYSIQDPPEGFTSWNTFWRSIGVPEDELDDEQDGGDRLLDPAGAGPSIWFQQVPEPKDHKNRLHFDITASGGRAVPLATRKERVLAEEQRLIAAGATRLRVLEQEGIDHFAVTMQDPEGNEFCIN